MTDRSTNDWTTLDSPASTEPTPDSSFLDAQRQAGLTTPEPSQPPGPPQQMDRRFCGTALLFIGGMTSMVVLALGLSSGVEAWQIHDRLTHWPHVEATVDFCETYYKQTHAADNVSIVFGMRCHVTYPVGSRQWKAAADLGYTQNDREPMLEWAHRFHPGDRLEIAYNPTFADSILFAGDPSLAYAAPIWKGRIAFWCFLATIVTLPFGFKLRSAGQ